MKNSTLKYIFIFLGSVLAGVIILVSAFFLLISVVFNFTPDGNFRTSSGIVELNNRQIQRLEDIYGMRLPESVEVVNGIRIPAFQDSRTHIWFDIAEEDFETIFLDGFWDEPKLRNNPFSAGYIEFTAIGRVWYIGDEGGIAGVNYSYPENGMIHIHFWARRNLIGIR